MLGKAHLLFDCRWGPYSCYNYFGSSVLVLLSPLSVKKRSSGPRKHVRTLWVPRFFGTEPDKN